MNSNWFTANSLRAAVFAFIIVGACERTSASGDMHRVLRERMVREQLEARGIEAPAVLNAMRVVSRHLFLPQKLEHHAYHDRPLHFREGHISQPIVVARLTELAEIQPQDRLLEIGTGTGYHTAVLSVLARYVVSIEIDQDRYKMAQIRLRNLGYLNVSVLHGDAFKLLPQMNERAFDVIVVTGGVESIPPSWFALLRDNGRLVAPIGKTPQRLTVIRKIGPNLSFETHQFASFLPLHQPKSSTQETSH